VEETQPTLIIRPAGPSDASHIAGLHSASALAGCADIFPADAPKPTPASLEKRWSELLQDASTTVLVAEAEKLIGCVALRTDHDVPSGLLLDRLYVHPLRWGQGIGNTLHETSLQTATERGARPINLWVLEENVRARRMYERRGWQVVPARKRPNNPPTVVDVLYQRLLR
jgi:GNAT superfamily N-acetyltransferase